MTALSFIHKQIVYLCIVHANFHNDWSRWTIVLNFSCCFRGSNVPNSVNSHSILLCKQFIWLFLSIQVYFSILCVLRCTGHMCSKMQWSETYKTIWECRNLVEGAAARLAALSGLFKLINFNNRNAPGQNTTVSLQIFYTKRVQLVYLGAKMLTRFPLVVLHSY